MAWQPVVKIMIGLYMVHTKDLCKYDKTNNTSCVFQPSGRFGGTENFCNFAKVLILYFRVFFHIFMSKIKLQFLYIVGSAPKSYQINKNMKMICTQYTF